MILAARSLRLAHDLAEVVDLPGHGTMTARERAHVDETAVRLPDECQVLHELCRRADDHSVVGDVDGPGVVVGGSLPASVAAGSGADVSVGSPVDCAAAGGEPTAAATTNATIASTATTAANAAAAYLLRPRAADRDRRDETVNVR